MTPEQMRAARAWLGWSQAELAKRAGVGVSTVQDFERGLRTPIANNLAALRRAIEAGGIRLLFDEAGSGAGVVRQDVENDLSIPLIFDQFGPAAGILRRGPRNSRGPGGNG